MLKFWNAETYFVKEGSADASYQVYQDDTRENVFYVVPKRPTLSINQQDKLSFVFRKYRKPMDTGRADGRLGGGYVIFDVVLKVPDESKKNIQEQLRKAYPKLENLEIASIPFSDGTVSLNISAKDNPDFVESIVALGKPSKDGDYTASFSAELSAEGATFFEQALNEANSGGAIQVFYSLKTWARTSDTTVKVTYNKSNALKYHQEIFKDVGSYSPGVTWREGKYQNTIRQTLEKNEVAKVDISWGSGTYTEDQTSSIRKWAMDSLSDAIKRQIADLSWMNDQGDAGQGKTIRDFDFSITSDFSQTYSENFAMPYELNPQGMLPNVGSMKDSKGTSYLWKDYFKTVDLDDDFFKTLRLGVSTDMDFGSLPVTRVVVDLEYHGTKKTLEFSKSDAARKTWEPYLVEGDQTYSYKYAIHFKEGAPYESEWVSATTKELVVGEGTQGLLAVDVMANGIDPSAIKQVLVKVVVVDEPSGKQGPSTFLFLSKDQVQQNLRLPVGREFKAPYVYDYTREYTLADGKKLSLGSTRARERQLLVSDPFTESREVTLRAALGAGEQVFVELSYAEGSDYSRTVQKSLTSDNPVAKWVFGVFNRSAGALSYSGQFQLKDGSTQELPVKTVTGNLISLRPAGRFSVTVDPSDIDWELESGTLKRVVVSLQYRNAEGEASQKKSFVFTAGKLPSTAPVYTLQLEGDRSRYEWQAAYYVEKDGKTTARSSEWTPSEDEFLFVPSLDSAPMKAA